MANKIIEFLFQIGFTIDDINEFYEKAYDFVEKDGRQSRGPDCIYAIVQEDEDSIDLNDTGELVEAYWEKGWISDFVHFRRNNFDSYKGTYYKAFPTRYKLPDFKLTKSMRRILKKNEDLKTVIRPLRITPAKSNLHDLYYFLRFGEQPRKSLLEDYKYIVYYPTKLMELCIFKENKLIACSIFEVGNFSTYSNTVFWDLTEKSRSLGTLTILLEIQYAIEQKMFYYYMGHFYPQNPNYHYKTRFGGLELYDWERDCWVSFNYRPRIKEMLKQKLPRRKYD